MKYGKYGETARALVGAFLLVVNAANPLCMVITSALSRGRTNAGASVTSCSLAHAAASAALASH